MSDVSATHEELEELAAAYALDALEHDDERRFLAHLATCPGCQRLVLEFGEVAAALAESIESLEPSPELRSRILAAAQESAREDSDASSVAVGAAAAEPKGLAPVVSLLHPRGRTRTLLASAAAVVVIVGGVLGGLLGTSGGPAAPSAGCVYSANCSAIVLSSSISHKPVATVIVSGKSVWLKPAGLSADDTAKQIYVLWEIEAHEPPRAIGGFDVSRGVRDDIDIGSLAFSYNKASAFAVTLEKGRTVPPRPSHPVAVGRIT